MGIESLIENFKCFGEGAVVPFYVYLPHTKASKLHTCKEEYDNNNMICNTILYNTTNNNRVALN